MSASDRSPLGTNTATINIVRGWTSSALRNSATASLNCRLAASAFARLTWASGFKGCRAQLQS